ncbi:MAG: hypothetical protein LBB21_07175 [Holosporaceae bacterium]|jgi:hypothetical protein|nr:hypothetical protein [Holosporaceae bacterium]
MKFKKTISLSVFALIFSIIDGAVFTSNVRAMDTVAPSAVSDGNVCAITDVEKRDLARNFILKHRSFINVYSKFSEFCGGQLCLGYKSDEPYGPERTHEMLVDV